MWKSEMIMLTISKYSIDDNYFVYQLQGTFVDFFGKIHVLN